MIKASSTSATAENESAMTDGSDAVFSSISNRIERLEKKIDELQTSFASRQSQSPPDNTDRRVREMKFKRYGYNAYVAVPPSQNSVPSPPPKLILFDILAPLSQTQI